MTLLESISMTFKILSLTILIMFSLFLIKSYMHKGLNKKMHSVRSIIPLISSVISIFLIFNLLIELQIIKTLSFTITTDDSFFINIKDNIDENCKLESFTTSQLLTSLTFLFITLPMFVIITAFVWNYCLMFYTIAEIDKGYFRGKQINKYDNKYLMNLEFVLRGVIVVVFLLLQGYMWAVFITHVPVIGDRSYKVFAIGINNFYQGLLNVGLISIILYLLILLWLAISHKKLRIEKKQKWNAVKFYTSGILLSIWVVYFGLYPWFYSKCPTLNNFIFPLLTTLSLLSTLMFYKYLFHNIWGNIYGIYRSYKIRRRWINRANI